MSRRKYGASVTTWWLPVRILLTLPLALPAWLVLRMLLVMGQPGEDPQQSMVRILMGFIGGALLLVAPRYLKSVWAPKPEWSADDRDAAALQRDLNRAMVPSPTDPGRSRPARTNRLRW